MKIPKIRSLDVKSMEECKKRWNEIAKPLNSLGKLEDILVQIAGIHRTPQIEISKKALVVMCADNGIVEEGVTQTGQEITKIVAENFLTGKATAGIMCQKAGAKIIPIDIGMVTDSKVEKRKVAYGTKNFLKEPAMSEEEAVKAITVGIELVKELKEKGYQLIATGEMGIGNTTTSSGIAAVLLDREVEEMTGRGAGLSSSGLERKIEVIKEGIKKHVPDKENPLDVLSKIGGFDIAGMCGLFIGGGIYEIPVLADGFISGVAALLAIRMVPDVKDYIIATHLSKEPAAKMVMEAIEKEPGMTLDMCLGEGTGAVAFFPILDLANTVYSQMTTFAGTNIKDYEPLK